MTAYSLYPCFLKVDYHSAYGAHVQLVPMRAWNEVPIVPGNVLGSWEGWDTTNRDGEVIVDALVNALAAFYPSTALIDDVTVYTMASETATPIPRATKHYATAGANVASGWKKATQQNIIMRDTAYNVFKLVLLDATWPTSLDPQTSITGDTIMETLVNLVTDPSAPFSSRAGFRPATFAKRTFTLNTKLRREYNMD